MNEEKLDPKTTVVETQASTKRQYTSTLPESNILVSLRGPSSNDQALFDRLVLVRYVIYTNLATDSTGLLVTSSVYEEQLDIVYNKCFNRE